MSKTPDKNFFSINGDDLGNIWVNGLIAFTADQPCPRVLEIGDIIPPGPKRSWNDGLKISGVRRLIVRAGVVDGTNCFEDGVDIAHTQDLELYIDRLIPGDKYCATVKGASQRAKIVVKTRVGHGSEVDFDFGNNMPAFPGKTIDCQLHVASSPEPTSVRLLQADDIEITSPYVYKFPNPTAWYHDFAVYCLVKFWSLFQ